MVKIKKWRRLFLGALLIGNLTGIILTFIEMNYFTESISYFTVQSNILVFGFFLYLFIVGKETKNIIKAKMAVTISIMLTFVVFHTLLAPYYDSPNFWMNFFVHTYTPLMVLLDYFLFDKKGCLEYKDVPWFLAFPIFYFIYINIYALGGGIFHYEESISRYPYFFLNPDLAGWGYVALYVLSISIIITLISFLFVFLDKKLIIEIERKEAK